MEKRIYFLKIKSLLIIILTIITMTVLFGSQHVYAVGTIESYINSSSVEQISNEALKDLFSQTGYRVGSQAEIDAIRQKAIKEVPELVKKSPVLFGSPLTAPTGEEIDKIMESDSQQFGISYSSTHDLQIAITADVRSWVNKYISSIPVKGDVESSVSSDSVVPSGTTCKVNTKTSFIVVHCNGNSWSYPRIGTYGGYNNISICSYETIVKQEFYNGMRISTSSVNFYDINNKLVNQWGGQQNVAYSGTAYPSAPSVSFSETDVYGQPISYITTTSKFDNTEALKDYVPYPTTQTEVGTQKVPTEIGIATTVGEDGLVTPQLPPPVYPSIKVIPNEDGIAQVGPATITYTDPTIDPDTGKIIDPIVTPPVVDPTIPPITDPTVPKNDVPQLDFRPLQVATRKFPFCIPWDLWDTYKIFESNSQPFKYEFKQVDVNFGFIGAGSVTVLPNFSLNFADYPQIDTAVKVFKFIELILFIVFLILKSRNLIRG